MIVTGPIFRIGDHVEKTSGGHTYSGIIVAAYQKLSGAWRYLIEDQDGASFIMTPSQVRLVKDVPEES